MKKSSRLLSIVLSLLLLFSPLLGNNLSVQAMSASRNDGIWLFPLSSSKYGSFSDWAACPGGDKCVLCGVYHSGWGDSYHSSQGGHNGIDISAAVNTDVYAAAPGKIVYAASMGARGNTIIVEHSIGNGYSYYSYYQHLNSFTKTSGSVSAGTVIGKVGNTGGNYGYHLHFGIVRGASSLGSSALSLESKGWLIGSGEQGRILNNPSQSNWNGNYAGAPKGSSAVLPPLQAHMGSVTYTFDASQVTIGATHTHNYDTYVYYWAAHPHYKCYKCSCGEVDSRISETTYVASCEQCNPPISMETYTVTYDANGGSDAPSSQAKAYGVNLTLSSVQPTRSGYTFLGWATSSTATSVSYQPGASYTANANLTLYAVWKKDETKVGSGTFWVDNVSGKPGEFVDVVVSVSATDYIESCNLELHYDSSVLQVESVEECNLGYPDLSDVNYDDPGVIKYAFAWPGASAKEGNFLSIRFLINEAAPAGQSIISLVSADIGNLDNILFELTLIYGSVAVTDIAAERVTEKINALPSLITANDKAMVEEVYEAYLSLTEAQKEAITAETLEKLQNARAVFLRLGDINVDDSINASDALMALQHSVHLIQLDEILSTVADVDQTGTIDASDALYILQYSVHLIDSFPSMRNPVWG